MNFLTLINGLVQRIATIAISTGSADADKIAATNSNGKFDNSFVNWEAPSAIGSTTPNTIKASSLTATNLSSGKLPIIGTNGLLGDWVWTGDLFGSVTLPSSSNIGFTGNNSGFLLNFRNNGVSFTRNGISITAGNNTGGGAVFLRFLSADSSVSSDFSMASGVVSLNRAFNITDTTASTSTVTGAHVVAGGGAYGGSLNVGDTLTVSKSVAGLFRSTFRNLDASAPRRCDVAILTGASEGIYIGSQPSGAYIDNRSGASLFFQTAGSSFLSIDASGNLVSTAATGSSNSAQGAIVVGAGMGVGGNLNVGGNVGITGTLKIGSGATITRKLRASTSVSTTIGMGATYTTTLTCTGAQVNDTVDVGAPANLPPAVIPTAFVSATNTITLNLYNANSLGAAINGTFTISVEG